MFFKRAHKEKMTENEEKKVNEKFDSFKNKSYSEEEVNKVFNNENKIMGKMKDKNLMGFIEDVKLFFLMLKEFFTRKYTEVPVGTIVAIVCSLLYVLSPVDIIPDFLSGIGYLDDAGIIGLCLKFVKADLDKFKEYKNADK